MEVPFKVKWFKADFHTVYIYMKEQILSCQDTQMSNTAKSLIMRQNINSVGIEKKTKVLLTSQRKRD